MTKLSGCFASALFSTMKCVILKFYINIYLCVEKSVTMDHCGTYIQPLILIANVFFNPELLQDYKDQSARLYHTPSVAPRLQTTHRVLDCKGCSFFRFIFQLPRNTTSWQQNILHSRS